MTATTEDVLREPTRELGELGDPDLDYDPAEVTAPAPAPRRRPGPAPNPNSARQRRKAAKAAAAPRKRTRPNTPAPAEPDNVYERGALTVIGWVAQPLAAAGLATAVAAELALKRNPEDRRGAQLGRLGQALTLDSLTLAAYSEPLAKGAAAMAPNLPWMARALERAAAISPYAQLGQAAVAVGLQMLCNHGILPVHAVLGTVGAEQLSRLAGLAQDAGE